MTGGDYGPEASTVTAIVLLIGMFVVYRATRNLAYLHTQPVIVAAGIPVDLDAMSSTLAPHHPVAPQPAPAGSTLGANRSRSRATAASDPTSRATRIKALSGQVCYPETSFPLRTKRYLQITCKWAHYWRHEGIAMVGLTTKEFFPAAAFLAVTAICSCTLGHAQVFTVQREHLGPKEANLTTVQPTKVALDTKR